MAAATNSLSPLGRSGNPFPHERIHPGVYKRSSPRFGIPHPNLHGGDCSFGPPGADSERENYRMSLVASIVPQSEKDSNAGRISPQAKGKAACLARMQSIRPLAGLNA